MRNQRVWCGKFVFVLMVASASNVHAAVFCVGTETELRTALTTAQSNSDSVNTIDIQSGTMAISGSSGMDGPAYNDPSSFHTLYVQGRFDASCTLSNVGDTTLDAGGHTNLLHINAPNGQIIVQGITFAHGNAVGDGTARERFT